MKKKREKDIYHMARRSTSKTKKRKLLKKTKFTATLPRGGGKRGREGERGEE